MAGGLPTTVALTEHTLSVEEIARRYDVEINAAQPTASQGLAHEQAQNKLASDGPNILSPPPTQQPWIKFLKCLFSLFNILLFFAGLCSFILYHIEKSQDHIIAGSVLIGAAFLNGCLEFYQLQKSDQLLKSFNNMVPSKCNVVRSGEMKSINASDLVKGDLVFLKLGEKVPADIYLIQCSDLKVDNSNLTGEAEPQERSVVNSAKSPFEATNLAFNGTLIVSGEGYGIVIRTGDDTLIGQIAGLTQKEKKRPSPLLQEIKTFVIIITIFAVTTAITFSIVLLLSGNPTSTGWTAITFAVGILTAWVPQGLPMTVTMLLTIAAKRMRKKNVLVKDLPGLETLGALTLLATDKTGTLTRNQMTVALLWTEQNMYSTVHDPSKYDSALLFDSNVQGLKDIMHISALCSRARFETAPTSILSSAQAAKTHIVGDPTDSGLLQLSAQKLRNFHELNDRFPKVLELPFNSDTKWHLSIHHMPHPTGVYTLLIKGAPERVLRLCSSILGPGGRPTELTKAHQDAFSDAYEHMAGKGHRVLAFAKLELNLQEYPENFVFSKEENNYPTSDLTFVGLVSLEDPPKHGVREAIGKCRLAGIKVVMVTGDHPLTAEAIARTINLMISDTKPMLAKKVGVAESAVDDDKVKAIVIHGEQIDSLTDEEWDMIFAKEEIIFARTSPAQKLQIVKRAQNLGHIVGVTGDGVNDSPALKKADLGIAMNLSGSDVSKESATMVLADDNFASIVNGIREGRLVFSNLKKGIQYVLTHSIPEVLPQLLYAIAGFPLAITTIQILLIDLIFELIAALPFAYEAPESDALMKLMPRRPVNAETITKRRELEEFNARFISQDVESPKGKEEVFTLTFRAKVRRFFTWEYWKHGALWSGQGGEVLVDWDVLSWSYLYAGFLEFMGAIVTFFVTLYIQEGMGFYEALHCMKITNFVDGKSYEYNGVSKTVQQGALRRGQSAFFLSILVIQFFNILACKCRFTSPLRKYVFSNPKTWYSMLAWIATSSLFIYVPHLNKALGMSGGFHYYPIFIAVGFGFLLYLCAWLKFCIKSKLHPPSFIPTPLGLQMHPTRWTQKA